jgi:3-oxoacyl-[acyl-carrier-protein] synthase III
VLRRRLENEREGEGTREYIRVLRLLEKHSLPEVRAAVEKALAVGAITRDAIAQFLFPREDWRGLVFSLDGYPHLRAVHIAPPDVRSYGVLLGGGR